jgi:hypothetical protein
MPKLTCPTCGKTYDNYREYFDCWTGHLTAKINSGPYLAPYLHDDAVRYYKDNPVETGLRVLASEVGVFHGRIDLVGVDRERRLVLIDVDNGHDPKRKTEQLRRYKRSIQWMGTHLFGLRPEDMPEIRLLIVNPNKYIKEV